MGYRQTADQHGLHIRFFDHVTHEDIVDCCVDLAASPAAIGSQYACIDFADRSQWSCSAPDLAMIASAAQQLLLDRRGRPHVFFVVPYGANCPRLPTARADGGIEIFHSHEQVRERIEALQLQH